jgi:uncharacterized protein (DUF433 family)
MVDLLPFLYFCLNISTLDYSKYITLDPQQRSGKPCVRGLRITVYEVLSYLAGGDSIQEVLDHFPMLSKEDILACLAYAADEDRKVKMAS